MNLVTAFGSSPVGDAPADTAGQELFELELRVARRADELARTAVPLQDRNYEFWLQAEREVMAKFAGSNPDSLQV